MILRDKHQKDVVRALLNAGGELTRSALTAAMGGGGGRMSDTVNALVADGLVREFKGDGDRRMVGLTDAGKLARF